MPIILTVTTATLKIGISQTSFMISKFYSLLTDCIADKIWSIFHISGIKVPISVCCTVHKFVLCGLCCTSCLKVQFLVIKDIDQIKHYCAFVCISLLDHLIWSLLETVMSCEMITKLRQSTRVRRNSSAALRLRLFHQSSYMCHLSVRRVQRPAQVLTLLLFQQVKGSPCYTWKQS
jgi:hypothetical protein